MAILKFKKTPWGVISVRIKDKDLLKLLGKGSLTRLKKAAAPAGRRRRGRKAKVAVGGNKTVGRRGRKAGAKKSTVKDVVLKLLAKKTVISPADVKKASKCSTSAAMITLKTLVKAGSLSKRGHGKYVIAGKGILPAKRKYVRRAASGKKSATRVQAAGRKRKIQTRAVKAEARAARASAPVTFNKVEAEA